MNRLLTASLVVVGIIHLLPLLGALGPSRLSALYGIAVAEPNLEILLRHRAVLFGVLGGLFVLAAFQRHLQAIALVAGFASVVSFLVLAYAIAGYNAELRRVIGADWIALAALAVGAAAFLRGRSGA